MTTEADTYRPLDEIMVPAAVTAITLLLAGTSALLLASVSWCAATASYWGPDGCHAGSGDKYLLWLIPLGLLLASCVRARAIPVFGAAAALGLLATLTFMGGDGAIGAVYLSFAYTYTFTAPGWLPRRWVPWTSPRLLGPRIPLRLIVGWFSHWLLIGFAVAALATTQVWQRF